MITIALIVSFVVICTIVIVPMVKNKRKPILYYSTGTSNSKTGTANSKTGTSTSKIVTTTAGKDCGRCNEDGDVSSSDKEKLVPDIRIESPRSVTPCLVD